MLRVQQPRDERVVPVGEAIAEWLALSAERDRYMGRILAAERRGFERGVAAMADEYERGFHDGCMAFKRAQHDAHALTEVEASRWELRGEKRTRATFGMPHPDDYKGRGAA